MSHTPGPWRVVPGDSVVSVVADGEQRVAATNTQTYFRRYTDEDLSNARLIAAAPELLAALKETLQIARRNEAGEFVHRASAAIAKAEGRS